MLTRGLLRSGLSSLWHGESDGASKDIKHSCHRTPAPKHALYKSLELFNPDSYSNVFRAGSSIFICLLARWSSRVSLRNALELLRCAAMMAFRHSFRRAEIEAQKMKRFMEKTKESGSCWRETVLACVVLLLVLSRVSLAQEGAEESRAGTITVQQEQKLKASHPPLPDRAEALLQRVEKIWLEDPSGFYPYFASVYHGGGLTLGAGYRRYFGDNTFWDVRGFTPIKNYKLAEGARRVEGSPGQAALLWRPVGLAGCHTGGLLWAGTWITAGRPRPTFAFNRPTSTATLFLAGAVDATEGQCGLRALEYTEGKGVDPSIETVYTPANRARTGRRSQLTSTPRLSAGIDWRQSPGYTRRGGLYQATFHDYRNNNGGTYSFQRLDGEVIQHIPLLRETWVLAVRGSVQTTLNDNDLIPYFLLPALGSGSTLRAFASDRFRDRHSMVLNAEFRWIPRSALDMAVFYDAGKVTSRRSDLNFKGLKSDVGIGARFHGLLQLPSRRSGRWQRGLEAGVSRAVRCF